MNDDLLDLLVSPATRPLLESMGYQLVVYNPHHGMCGKPYTTAAIRADGIVKESFWTQAEALDRRDQLLDEGWDHVIVLGLPTIISVGGSVGGEP